jgi:membrane protein
MNLHKFLENDIWQFPTKAKGLPRQLLEGLLAVFVAGRDFIEDKAPLRASALTYYTVLSVVPVLAMAFAVAKGFGFEETLRERIMSTSEQNREVLLYLFQFAENALANVQGGLIAGIGVIMLLYSVVRMLSLIEESFNAVWMVGKARSWLRKFTDYTAIAIFAPIIIIFSGSATVFLGSNLEEFARQWGWYDTVGGLLTFITGGIPILLVLGLFAALYMIMPNTRVKPMAAIPAGIIAGLLYVGVEWVYVSFQIGVSNYNGIYGSFAALPLFLFWVQLSWTIVLFGAELSYAFQNITDLVKKRQRVTLGTIGRFKLMLAILKQLLHERNSGQPLVAVSKLAATLETTEGTLRSALYELEKAGLVAGNEVEGREEYVATYDREQTDMLLVIEKLTKKEEYQHDILPEWDKSIEALRKAVQASDANKKVADL